MEVLNNRNTLETQILKNITTPIAMKVDLVEVASIRIAMKEILTQDWMGQENITPIVTMEDHMEEEINTEDPKSKYKKHQKPTK